MLYTCIIYDRHGLCLFYKEWQHEGMKRKKRTAVEADGDSKLVYGLLFSLKAFNNGIAPKPYVVAKYIFFTLVRTRGIHTRQAPTSFTFMIHQRDTNLFCLRTPMCPPLPIIWNTFTRPSLPNMWKRIPCTNWAPKSRATCLKSNWTSMCNSIPFIRRKIILVFASFGDVPDPYYAVILTCH